MNSTVKRSISGIVFVGIVLAGLLLHKLAFAALMLLVMVSCMHEFHAMTVGGKFIPVRIASVFTGVTLFCLVFAVNAWGIPAKYCSLSFVPLLSAIVLSLYSREREAGDNFSAVFTSLVYIALPVSLSPYLVFNGAGEFSGMTVLGFFLIVWASDIGAYCWGLLLGRNGRKLFPSLSPKKSWAGFWGGLAMSMLTGAVLGWIGLLDFPILHCVALSAVMNVAGVYGDLFESHWKRLSGIKDSGNIIPGHGGMLDRFDSSLLAMPAGAIYLITVNLI